jgi:uncharacterized protein (TIGR02646 family)
MKNIIKTSEPRELTQEREAGASFENLTADTKSKLKKALLNEQGGLCCYCMQNINVENMRIEHFKPQSKYNGKVFNDGITYPDLTLKYDNLLAACHGHETDPERNGNDIRHCDVKKGNIEITIDPTDSIHNCENQVKYKKSTNPNDRNLFGVEIFSDDPQINSDLNDTLNLNMVYIKGNRGGILKGLLDYMHRAYGQNGWSVNSIRNEINKWCNRTNDNNFREYCMVVVYFLKKRIGA